MVIYLVFNQLWDSYFMVVARARIDWCITYEWTQSLETFSSKAPKNDIERTVYELYISSQDHKNN